MEHWKITVTGRVQGVYFRASTKAVADHLGVKGIVQNQADGHSVFIEAEGDLFALESLLEFCQEGPEKAQVDQVSHQRSKELMGYKNFEIIKKPKI